MVVFCGVRGRQYLETRSWMLGIVRRCIPDQLFRAALLGDGEIQHAGLRGDLCLKHKFVVKRIRQIALRPNDG